MILQILKPFIRLIIIITSTLLSYFYIAPQFETDPKLIGLYGCLFGIILALLILPIYDEKVQEDDEIENLFKKSLDSFSHPTNLPLTYSMIYFVILVIGAFIINVINPNFTVPLAITGILLSPIAILWGYSGFLMVRRNEFIDKFGRQYKGFWAYFNGILFILMGWGLLIVAIISYIFDL